jgi:hypothetical protein
MSWGFFFDLRAELPEASLATLQERTPNDHPVPAGWPGGEGHQLAGYFKPEASCLGDSFEKILAYELFKKEAVNKVEKGAGKARVQVTVMLDRSQMNMGTLIGSLFLAIGSLDGTGTLRIFNDGTGPDEDGWALTLGKGGKVATKPIGEVVEDLWALREEVGAEIYGGEAFE